MEPVTHLLTGAVLARAGFNRKSALATLVMTLAAEAPDLDILASLRGSAYGFIQHRGITHTLVGVPFIAALVVGMAWLADALWQRFRRYRHWSAAPPRRWGLLYLFACIAVLSHLLLDFTNSYGLRPFYPFVRQWYAWDIVFIIEPLMLLVLVVALLLPWLFGLVGQEIGERRRTPRGRGMAIAALVFIVALWGVRDYEHRRALALVDAFEYNGEAARRVAAFPYMVNPFRWAGVAETSNAYVSVAVNTTRPAPASRTQSYYKPDPTPATEAARSSELGRAYLEWARFPLVEAEHLSSPNGEELVRFMDARFLYPDSSGGRRIPLRAYVLLDSHLYVKEQGFGEPRPD
jgi:inner membrane protein